MNNFNINKYNNKKYIKNKFKKTHNYQNKGNIKNNKYIIFNAIGIKKGK